MYDVIVVGAGPSGSQVALELARAGHRVAVFEEHAEIGQPVCCSGIIGRECAERFALPQELILRQANSARIVAPSGSWLRVWNAEPQAYIIDRAAFDAAWACRAQAEGAELFMASRVRSIAVLSHGVSVEVERSGEQACFSAQVAVIAAGFASRFPQRLGLGQLADFIAGAQAEVDANEVEEVEVYLGRGMAPGFFAWLVPTSEGKALAGLFSRRKPGSYLRDFLALLRSQGKIASERANIGFDGIPLRPRSKTCGDRVIVIGDAAGQVKPITGGGIYYGLLCAEMAAQTIHEALEEGDCSARLLSRYERRWRRKLGRELSTGYLARRLFERLSDGQMEELFAVIKSHRLHEVLLQGPGLYFDRHGQLIRRGLKLLAPWRLWPIISPRRLMQTE